MTDSNESRRAEIKRLLAHVAGHKATVENAFKAGVPPFGWGLAEVLTYGQQFLDLRERLRQTDPVRFGDLPTHDYGASIVSRNSLLRQILVEMQGVLVTGHQLGLCEQPATLDLKPEKAHEVRPFLRNHAREIIIGVAIAVIAGGILYAVGWTH